jgi:hypothetical protein
MNALKNFGGFNMAYKFQLGAARLSGSIVQEGNIEAESANVSASQVQVPDSGLILAGVAVSATAAEINKLDGLAASQAELDYLAGADANINTLVLPASTTISSFGATLVDDADAAAARSTMGVVIGTDVQAQDAGLQYLADLAITDQATFQEQVGLQIGVDVQAYDAELAAIAGLTSEANKGIQFTGAGTAATYDLTAFAKTILDDADAAAARNTLELGANDDVRFAAISGSVIDASIVISSSGDISASADIWAGGGLYGASIGLADASGIVASNGGLDQTGGELHLAAAVAGNGIDLTSGVLSVDFASDGALQFIGASSDELSLKIKDNSLTKDAAGVGVKLKSEAGGTISLDANGLYIADAAIANAKLANSTISGKALGANLDNLTNGNGISVLSYNGSSAASVQIQLETTNALALSSNGIDLKGTIAGARTFSDDMTINASASISGDLTVLGDLDVQGDLTYIDTTNLKVSDALITFGAGSTSFATGYGFELGFSGDGTDWASFKTAQADIDNDTVNENIFDSSLPIQAPSMAATTFYGQLVGSFQESVSVFTTGGNLAAGVNKAGAYSSPLTMLLPSGAAKGTVVRVKGGPQTDVNKEIFIVRQGSDTIDGTNTGITLESPQAAVSLIKISTTEWAVF